MHLLKRSSDGTFSRKRYLEKDLPRYAILSHRWGDDEPTFQDLSTINIDMKEGREKLEFCAKRAKKDGLRYFWIDTVCIDKTSSAELSEALISMFKYYQKSTKCYVFMQDVESEQWGLDFRQSELHSRAWCLQELLAPKTVEFFASDGTKIGTKRSLESDISEVTGIPVSALRGQPLHQFSIDERKAWAQNREATREEDLAYCLFGIFNVHLPVLYGEGKESAFRKLDEEIAKRRYVEDLGYHHFWRSGQNEDSRNSYRNTIPGYQLNRETVYQSPMVNRAPLSGVRDMNDEQDAYAQRSMAFMTENGGISQQPAYEFQDAHYQNNYTPGAIYSQPSLQSGSIQSSQAEDEILRSQSYSPGHVSYSNQYAGNTFYSNPYLQHGSEEQASNGWEARVYMPHERSGSQPQ